MGPKEDILDRLLGAANAKTAEPLFSAATQAANTLKREHQEDLALSEQTDKVLDNINQKLFQLEVADQRAITAYHSATTESMEKQEELFGKINEREEHFFGGLIDKVNRIFDPDNTVDAWKADIQTIEREKERVKAQTLQDASITQGNRITLKKSLKDVEFSQKREQRETQFAQQHLDIASTLIELRKQQSDLVRGLSKEKLLLITQTPTDKLTPEFMEAHDLSPETVRSVVQAREMADIAQAEAVIKFQNLELQQMMAGLDLSTMTDEDAATMNIPLGIFRAAKRNEETAEIALETGRMTKERAEREKRTSQVDTAVVSQQEALELYGMSAAEYAEHKLAQDSRRANLGATIAKIESTQQSIAIKNQAMHENAKKLFLASANPVELERAAQPFADDPSLGSINIDAFTVTRTEMDAALGQNRTLQEEAVAREAAFQASMGSMIGAVDNMGRLNGTPLPGDMPLSAKLDAIASSEQTPVNHRNSLAYLSKQAAAFENMSPAEREIAKLAITANANRTQAIMTSMLNGKLALLPKGAKNGATEYYTSGKIESDISAAGVLTETALLRNESTGNQITDSMLAQLNATVAGIELGFDPVESPSMSEDEKLQAKLSQVMNDPAALSQVMDAGFNVAAIAAYKEIARDHKMVDFAADLNSKNPQNVLRNGAGQFDHKTLWAQGASGQQFTLSTYLERSDPPLSQSDFEFLFYQKATSNLRAIMRSSRAGALSMAALARLLFQNEPELMTMNFYNTWMSFTQPGVSLDTFGDWQRARETTQDQEGMLRWSRQQGHRAPRIQRADGTWHWPTREDELANWEGERPSIFESLGNIFSGDEEED